MAQLSTDTLIYSQIIAKVQDFLIKYSGNQNNQPEDFDKEYKKLLSDIEKTIGKPITEVDFFQKGEIPSSDKLNRYSKNVSVDINNIMHQFDSLVANYVNSFNKYTNEIESEKNFLSRIKSKINVLELYSNSSANNITYFGDDLNNLDFIDTTKIRSGYMPDVSDGFATLARKNTKKISANIKVANQNYDNESSKQIAYVDISNGLKGCFHLYEKNETNNNPFIYEKDSSLLRSNELAMLDESPATYFEYESIKIIGLDSNLDYETQYALSHNDSNQSYINWANFDVTKPLKLTVELSVKNKNGEYINYISIVPFFGYANIDLIKNIKVSSIKFLDEKQNTIKTLINESNSATIGADISAPSLSTKNNYFYNKGVFRFERVKANKVYITFEQSAFNDVTIKKPYWTPYDDSNLAKTNNAASSWRGQTKFVPTAIVSNNSNYRSEDISWNKKSVIPFIDRPTEIKSSSSDIVPIRIKYWQQDQADFKRVKLQVSNLLSYYLSNDRTNVDGVLVRIYSTSSQNAAKYNPTDTYVDTMLVSLAEEKDALNIVLPEGQDINSYVNGQKVYISSISATSGTATIKTANNHNLNSGDKVFVNASRESGYDSVLGVDWTMNKGVYTVVGTPDSKTFTVLISSGSLPLKQFSYAYFIRVSIVPTLQNLSIESFKEGANTQKFKDIFLKRNFEYVKAKRASIGIRDLSVGLETYSDVSELISKPYPLYGNLDLVSLQVEDFTPVEKNASGQVIGTSKISYYISVDGGSKWIEISPMEKGFSGIPEVLAFNQNLSNSSSLPQIAYFNSPEVPQKINSIIFKAVMRKDRNVNATPILYSYKLGLKVS